MPDSRAAILSASIDILRDPDGPALTLESAARAAGLSKPGLMYHFPTKQALVHAVMAHVVGQWADRIAATLGTPREAASSSQRIAAYVRTVVSVEPDLSDLAVLFQLHYRAEMSAVWVELMEPWLTIADDVPDAERARLMAARLAADGAWYAAASGWFLGDRDAVAEAILSLLQ
jgi:AcrR family transcriptional regulator